jgi:E3 ubiquitin-protein ligase synoviolin
MIKLGIYVALFFMLLRFYGLPIHMMRDLFMTSRDFLKRLGALLRYRRAIQEMKKYPDATAEDLSRENTCIICREEMHPWDENNDNSAVDRVRPKKLPCNHILHLGCLKSWLERQQVCPTCRTPVTEDRARAPQNRAAGLRIQIGAGAAAPGQPPMQQPGNADNAAAPPAANQPAPQGGAGGARVFNLGPLRLGFGAGPQVQDLARQFGIPQAQANPAAAQAAPATAPAPAPVPTTAQIGLSDDNLQNVSFLLHTAEAQIQRELHSIQASQHELQTISLLLAELQRIRQRQQIIGAPVIPPAMGVSPTLPYTIPPPGPFPLTGFGPFPGMPPRISTPIIGRHVAAPNATAIPAGSPDLPEGVVIPPGWSLMPLQRLDGTQSIVQPAPAAPTAPMPVPIAATGEASGAGPTLAGVAQPTPSTNGVGEGESSTRAPPSAPSSDVAPRPEQPSVISPSPVMPNWGGSAQLFRNSARLDNNDNVSQAPSQTESADDHVPASSSASASTAPVTPARAPQEEAAGKEKSRAVTVEDASDSSDSEDEEDEDDE